MKQHEYRTTWAWIAVGQCEMAHPTPPDDTGLWMLLCSAASHDRLFWFWSRFQSPPRPEHAEGDE